MRPCHCLVLLCWCLALTGCAGEGDVSGVVKYKGAPLKMGLVAFYQDNKVWSGPLNPDGSFTVRKVRTGTAKITVVTPVPIGMPGLPALKDIVAVPAKYGDPEQSGLTYDVRKGPQ